VGTVKDMYKRYYAYGDAAEQTVSTGQKYRYTGKPFDDEGAFDLYYYGARYYDPRLGRFIAVDPSASKYPSGSPYAYTLDNPLNYNDPDGKGSRPSGSQDVIQRRDVQQDNWFVNQNLIDAKVLLDQGLDKARTGTLTALDFVSDQSGKAAIVGLTLSYSFAHADRPVIAGYFAAIGTGAMVTQVGAELGKNILGEGDLKKTIILGATAAVSRGSSAGIEELGLDKTSTLLLRNFTDAVIDLLGFSIQKNIVPETKHQDEEDEEVDQP